MSGARETIFRVQDAGGRGPWKPGFSPQWVDLARSEWPPPIYDELNIHPHHLGRLVPIGMNAGCGCWTMEGLRRWFSRAELRRLSRHGYSVVRVVPDKILAETPTQVLFGCFKPLSDIAGPS